MGVGVAPEALSSGRNRRLRDVVASKLMLDWSPEQISGWLKTRYPNNENMHVSTRLFIAACSFKREEY